MSIPPFAIPPISVLLAKQKDRRNSLRSPLLLFQAPTRLADGFGLKELPYPSPHEKEYTPLFGSPVPATRRDSAAIYLSTAPAAARAPRL